MNNVTIFALSALAVTFAVTSAQGKVYDNWTHQLGVPYVDDEASGRTVTKTADTDDGVCDADCSLREAIAAAGPGDTILFSALFETPQTITLAGSQLVIDKELAIAGPGADRLTVSGNSQSRVFHVLPLAQLSVSGMTITGGNAGAGGGIFNEGSLTVTECHVTGNTAGSGGGIGSLFGSLTLRNSTISNNTAVNRGGGIWHDSAVGHLVTIANSTVSGNTVTDVRGEGGGIWAISTAAVGPPDVMIWNSTITNNSPGGVYAAAAHRGVDVSSSIVAANQNNSVVPDVDGHFSTSGYNLIGNRGTADGLYELFLPSIIGNSVVLADPKLAPLANNGGPTPTHALLPCSLAIDRGRNFVGADDQRGTGFSRRVDFPEILNPTDGDGSDIGAFEAQTFTPAVCNSAAPIIEGASLTLQQGTSARLEIATVADADGLFGVDVFVSSANPSNGVSVSNVRMDSLGIISADIAASCDASSASFTLTAHDGELQASDTLVVAVTPETTPPTLILRTQSIVLLPSDHKYRTVNIFELVVGASDGCDSSVNFDSVVIAQATSDEPENTPGRSDGNTSDDIVIAPDCKSVQLRAERDGERDGRVYTIRLRVRDAGGNTTTATRQVTVPLNQNGVVAGENEAQYVVVSSCP